mgnify:FL=1
MLGKSGSTIKYLVALSSTNLAVIGSTNASNFAGYEFATLFVLASSAPSAQGYVVNVMRSGTSGGTFANFGASVAVTAKNLRGLHVRSFSLDSSANWYKASYDNNNTGSGTIAIMFGLDAGRVAPVDTQDADVTLYSTVLGG